ncbi:MAG: hypothetical protein PHU56_03380 [Candidatus Pacebacteria bacterium]|nr:hypothetical protein [Candidatus Paceibacterota bacterium]
MNEHKFENLDMKERAIRAMREKVRQEMEEYRVKHLNDKLSKPDQYRIGYLNNFLSKILWQGESIREAGLSDRKGWGENSSALAKSQTYGEFFDVIDREMKKAGLDREELRRLEQEERIKKGEDRDFNPLVDKIIDLYINLRVMGYNHRDLC